ncbi:MAG TPA: DbpA RNA binding domain-containing protein, partial [Gemmatimonadales bacterium]|nr:DbpA RNA binding domain-containing protein [Gemmatimonadales bacterium]
PHAEPWLSGVVRGRRPLRLTDTLDRARDEAARSRAQVVARIDAGVPAGALFALAPLFERYDGAEVAGALYELWGAAMAARPAAAPAPVVMPASETGRMWVGVGSIDGVTPNDLVAALVKDLKFERSRIGKIEIREKFSLVELPASDIEKVAAALTGKSVRRRRVVARADRGATPRGESAGSGRPRPAGPRKPRPRS